MDYFTTKPVMKFIEYKWPLVLKYTIRKLFYPFCLMLLTYVTYMNAIYNYRDAYEIDPDTGKETDVYTSFHNANYIFQGVLVFFSLYFLQNEASQFYEEGLSYLASFWNFLDITPPILLLIFVPLELIGFFDYNTNGTPAADASMERTIEACM